MDINEAREITKQARRHRIDYDKEAILKEIAKSARDGGNFAVISVAPYSLLECTELLVERKFKFHIVDGFQFHIEWGE